MMRDTVKEDVDQKLFELPIADDVIAAAYYRLDGADVVLVHTEVPAEYSGQGIATELAHGTFGLLRKTGRKAIPKCPFMGNFVARHPQYADLVAG